MVTRVVFDSETKKISVVNTFLATEIELEINADLLGVVDGDELFELVKQSGGVNKFKAVAEDALRRSRTRKR